jgi:hypothetical protein
MDSIDSSRVERRARVRYELVRARRALVGFAPVLALVVVASHVDTHPSAALTFGMSAFVLGAVFLWYGRDLKRAVLPGLAAGLIPLGLAICARHVGHACVGDCCMVLCVPACTVGGLIAGASVAIGAMRRDLGFGFWLAASIVALLTGAMGCACAGYSGVVGLALGYAVGVGPALAHRHLLRKARLR